MLGKDMSCMVEKVCEPPDGMSIEGFFMNTVPGLENCQYVKGSYVLQLERQRKEACGENKKSSGKSKTNVSKPLVGTNTRQCISQNTQVLQTNKNHLNIPEACIHLIRCDENIQRNGHEILVDEISSKRRKEKVSKKNDNPVDNVVKNSKKRSAKLPKRFCEESDEENSPERKRHKARKVNIKNRNVEIEDLTQSIDEGKDVPLQLNTTGNHSMVLRKSSLRHVFNQSDDLDSSWEPSKLKKKSKRRPRLLMKRGKKKTVNKTTQENGNVGSRNRSGTGQSDKDDGQVQAASDKVLNLTSNDKGNEGEIQGRQKKNSSETVGEGDKKKDSTSKRGKAQPRKEAKKSTKPHKKQPQQGEEISSKPCKPTSKTQESVKKPEECAITAKRGSLKYLKQREEYLKAVVRETECEDDFFEDSSFPKRSKLSNLISMDSNDTLSIKTPKGKRTSDENPATPRTEFLGQWGITKQTETAYTPTHKSAEEEKGAEKEGVMETIYHQLKKQKKGSCGIRKKEKKAYESILKPQSSMLELPGLSEVSGVVEGDSSGHEDDYFNTSEAF